MDNKLFILRVLIIFATLQRTSLEFQSLRARSALDYEGTWGKDSNSDGPLGRFEVVISALLSGSLRGGTMVVYLDDSIPRDVQEAIMTLEAMQETPHVTLSLGVNQTCWWWSDQPDPAFIYGGSFVLHLVLFLTDPTKSLQSLWQDWKPRYLLLFSLPSSNSDATILDHEVFHRVQKLALIMELPNDIVGTPRTLGVYTLHPFSMGGPTFLGKWEARYHTRWENLFPDRFPSFEGHNFELATRQDDHPFIYRRNTTGGTVASGVTVEMINFLSSKLNFTYAMTIASPSTEWGVLRNGSWSGLLGMVQTKEKDFSINNFFTNLDRFKDFEASTPCWDDGFGFVLMLQGPVVEWLNVHRPFSPLVWGAVAITFFVAVCLLTLQERVGGQPFLGGGVVSTWLYLQRGMFAQGVPALPRALWQRAFLALWYLYCLLVSIYYTSNLVAIFTNPTIPQRIHTLHQLADSDYRLAVKNDGNSFMPVLRASKDVVYRKLSQKIDLFAEEGEAVAALKAGTHTYVDASNYVHVRLRVHYKLFDWYIVKEEFMHSPISWIFPKHTPWKSKIDQGISKMREMGLIQHWFTVETESLLGWEWKLHQKDLLAKRTTMVLTLHHLRGVFYIMVFAWVASIAVFLLELLRPRCSHC